jgi:beta-lactamase class A
MGAAGRGELEARVRTLAAGLPGQVAVAAERLRDGARLAINADLRLPAASVIKFPILTTLCAAAAAGVVSLSSEVVIDAHDVGLLDGEDGSGVLRHLRPRRGWTLGELALLTHMVSDNVATNALIDVLGGFDVVNRLMGELELTGSVLNARIQDFGQLQTANLVTAGDMVRLLRHLHDGTVPGARETLAIMQHQVYNDMIPLHLPADAEVLHKSGGLEGVVNDVGLVYPRGERGRGYAIALLSRGQAPNAVARLALAKMSRVVYEHWCA